MASPFGGVHSIQLSYGCVARIIHKMTTAVSTELSHDHRPPKAIPPSAPFPFKISMLQLLVLVKKAPRVPLLKSRGRFFLASRVDVMTSAFLLS